MNLTPTAILPILFYFMKHLNSSYTEAAVSSYSLQNPPALMWQNPYIPLLLKGLCNCYKYLYNTF